MKLNTLFLSVLLVPFAIASISASDIGVEDLKKDLHTRELELSKRGIEISEKQEYIEQMILEYARILKSVDEKERNQLTQKLDKFMEQVDEIIVLSEDNDFFLNEIFYNTKNDILLRKLEIILIRIFIEEQILKRLLFQYGTYFCNASKIHKKILNFQK